MYNLRHLFNDESNMSSNKEPGPNAIGELPDQWGTVSSLQGIKQTFEGRFNQYRCGVHGTYPLDLGDNGGDLVLITQFCELVTPLMRVPEYKEDAREKILGLISVLPSGTVGFPLFIQLLYDQYMSIDGAELDEILSFIIPGLGLPRFYRMFSGHHHACWNRFDIPSYLDNPTLVERFPALRVLVIFALGKDSESGATAYQNGVDAYAQQIIGLLSQQSVDN